MNETNTKYVINDGIKCYSPEMAYANKDYPSDVFQFLYEAEELNFWFISRNKIIQHLFRKYIGTKKSQILEIGCGTGYILKGLQDEFPDYKLMGSEIHLKGINFARQRLPNIEFIQLDATQIPFVNLFDSIGAFDVLEHIEEDSKVIQEVYKALKPNSYFILSVPQYKWMWSVTDDIAFHKRRYTRKELKFKLENENFEVVYLGSFVFTLFPIMVLSRWFKQNKNVKDFSTQNIRTELNELKLNPILNSIFLILMKTDEFLIKLGFSLPFGGSLIAVAKKKS